MIYFLQGFYLHAVSEDFLESSGTICDVLREMIPGGQYAGLFGEDSHDVEVLSGRMTDSLGQSLLLDIQLADDRLAFAQVRDSASEYVQFHLRRHFDGTWRGMYAGTTTPQGATLCVVTPLVVESLIVTKSST